ncbi:hypothetical protein [Streptomyces sp. NPDC058683]|uniref:hypothetical protein n=1 Tax=Streptomyces sp. NPDC058683 TaxID=3346597 RepID=UPI003646AD82
MFTDGEFLPVHAALSAAGNGVALHRVPGVPHMSDGPAPATRAGRRAVEARATAFAHGIGGDGD